MFGQMLIGNKSCRLGYIRCELLVRLVGFGHVSVGH